MAEEVVANSQEVAAPSTRELETITAARSRRAVRAGLWAAGAAVVLIGLILLMSHHAPAASPRTAASITQRAR